MDGFKTYHIGLLHSKAYRAVRYFMADFLKKYDLTPMEWNLVGHVCDDSKKGSKTSELAEQFGVEISLMTNSINKLVSKGLVTRTADKRDRRAKAILITDSGTAMVESIETKLAEAMTEWLEEVEPESLAHYVSVLKTLAGMRK